MTHTISGEKMQYYLPSNDKRKYDIKVYSESVMFEGKYWYLKDKEFYNCKNEQDFMLLKDFMGMGYLSKRSYKKCVIFVICGSMLSLINAAIDRLDEMIDEANSILHWIGRTLNLPIACDYILNIAAVICVLFGFLLFFSKKNVIEISFVGKRICIPKESVTEKEYSELYKALKTDYNFIKCDCT